MAKRKPHDPAKATQAAFERREREAELARLEAQGAKVTVDREGKILSAYRSNVFNLLLSRGTITANHHDAAHTLCLAWAQWKGLDGKPEQTGELVDGSTGARELVTHRMLTAGWRLFGRRSPRVRGIFEDLTASERALLSAFMVATVEEDRPMAWRGIVQRVTGETVRDKQTELVVSALEGLRVIYQEPGRVAA